MAMKLNSDLSVLPSLTNYIMNAKFGSAVVCDVQYQSDFKMSVPATGIIDVHAKKSWEFNIYPG